MNRHDRKHLDLSQEIKSGVRKIMARWDNEAGVTTTSVSVIRAWLKMPGTATLEALSQALAEIPRQTHRPAEFGEMELALQWVAFFDGLVDSRFERALANLRPATVIETRSARSERSFLRFLYESRLQSRLGRLTLPPLLAPSRLLSPQETFFSSILTALHGPAKQSSSKVCVDLRNFEVVTANERVRSRSACVALDLFRRERSMSFEDFSQAVFGVQGYDVIRHESQVRNLLNRIKSLGSTVSMRIQTKEQRIYTDVDWDRFEFSYPSAHEEIRRCAAWKEFLSERALSEASDARTRSLPLDRVRRAFTGTFTRAQLQELMNLSRSTAGRRLASWVALGLLSASGAGPKTAYRFAAPAPHKKTKE